jgi:hypothetical protein
MRRALVPIHVGFVSLLLAGTVALAQAPVIGSSNTVTAEPGVPHPPGKPQVVQLFQNQAFADFSLKEFAYVPPPAPGPWAKVVFVGDFQVSEGIQYDRTAQVTLGHVNIFYGTTPEPDPTHGRTWHVERDLTEYAALLETPQGCEVNLGNLVDSTYTGVITGSARLEFYPATDRDPAPRVPDRVLPLRDASGGALALQDSSSLLSATLDLPATIERACLDVFTQGQSNDEFWYTSVPDDVAAELYSSPGTGFREGEITLDGQPAGVAPVYPWIFTGGLDPNLWIPIPGIQTLDFKPYRVDLTPFAGVLDEPGPHTLALSVFNSQDYFLADGTLFLYLDHGSQRVRGALTENTLAAAPDPVVVESLTNANGTLQGTVSVTSKRHFVQAGYVLTSHGRVDTRVDQEVDFSNRQAFVIDASLYQQNITQDTRVHVLTRRSEGGIEETGETRLDYPLTVDYSQPTNADGSISVVVTVKQGDATGAGDDRVETTDTTTYDASGDYLGNQGQKSSQTCEVLGPWPWFMKLEAAGGVLTRIEGGAR